MSYRIALLFAVIFAGCDERNEVINPGTPSPAVLVDLHPGQSFRPPGSTFTARFDSVTSDSRCPLGVQCIWAGDGATGLTIVWDVGPANACTLHTTLSPNIITVGGYYIQLKELDPYPRYGTPTNPAAYIALLQAGPIYFID